MLVKPLVRWGPLRRQGSCPSGVGGMLVEGFCFCWVDRRGGWR